MIRPSLLFALALSLALPMAARERITSFNADIQIQADANILVTESIDVIAENSQIRHGIYREIPTILPRSKDEGFLGSLARYEMPFEFLGAERDGHQEDYHTRRMNNGWRYYLGNSSSFVSPGPHHYVFRYRMGRALGFFKDHDELYWNVNGNGWSFPIDAVSADVSLPTPAPITVEAYTGPQGSQGRDYKAEDLGQGKAHFESTRPFSPGEGLTLVAGFPKGLVRESDSGFWQDWGLVILAVFSLGISFAWLLWAWVQYGQDPEPRPLVPLFYPPRELSPAVMRHADERPDDSAFAATLLSLAVLGRIKIEKGKKSDQWLLSPVDRSESGLDSTQKAAMGLFIPGIGNLRDTAREADLGAFRSAKISHDSAMEASYKSGTAFNFVKLLPAMALLMLSSTAIAMSGPSIQNIPAPLMAGIAYLLNLILWGGIGLFITSLRLGRLGINGAQLAGGFFLAFFGGTASAFLAWQFYIEGAPLLVLHAYFSSALLAVFTMLMPQPSKDHVRLRDEIAGFTHYLGTAEKDRLEKLNPPKETPQLFERYLPYALALGVANEWNARFEKMLEVAAKDPGTYGLCPYLPYNSFGRSGFGSFSDFGSSFSSSISSASAPPSSSGGGGGGGGSSGGGGGGGGGGGW